MAKIQEKSTVIKGILYPSSKDIRAIVNALRKQVAEDPRIAKLFKKDPRRTLASFGLNEDLQSELLREMDVTVSPDILKGWCVCTDCCRTCWCTDCCITEIEITNRL